MYLSGSADSRAARSLADWWLVHKSWTQKQWLYARALVNRDRKKKAKPKVKKYYLYAITDGEFIKLGYSSSISGRLKAMQTGHPKPLKCLWRYYVGKTEAVARRLERKLHKYCSKQRVRGEWFSMACAARVEEFSAKNEKAQQEIEQELDLEALKNSPI